MTRATTPSTTSALPTVARRSRTWFVGVAALGLLVAACGGDDDDATDTTTTTVVAAATTTTAAPTTVATTTTTLPPVEYVTEGATVVVANASGINGAAGRLTERLAVVGYDMAEATNSADTVSSLATTQIYYDSAVEAAQAVAESLQQALGGGDIELLEVTLPAPTASGDLGAASVLVLMGDDVADKSLDELQGRVPPAETTGDETTGEETTGEETTGEETTGEETTGEETSAEN